MTDSIVIAEQFHGPPASGNGGYSCGMLGKLIDGSAAVRLRIPPPLDVRMAIHMDDDGVELFHADQLVATGKPAPVDIEVPTPPDYAAAEAASRRYKGFEEHYYPGCFVCGPDREHGDGLRIFAGPVEAGFGPAGMVAATWIPHESLCNAMGQVEAEFVWAALDCPGAYTFPAPASGAILLGEVAA